MIVSFSPPLTSSIFHVLRREQGQTRVKRQLAFTRRRWAVMPGTVEEAPRSSRPGLGFAFAG